MMNLGLYQQVHETEKDKEKKKTITTTTEVGTCVPCLKTQSCVSSFEILADYKP